MATEQPASRHTADRGGADAATVLLVPLNDRLRLFLGAPAVALIVFLAGPPLSRWLIDQRVALPVRPVFRLAAAVDRPWEVAVSAVVALLLGAAVSLVRLTSSARVAVSDDEVRVATDDWSRTVPRADVSAVFLDRGKLVVLDKESRQFASEHTRVPAATLAEAFRAHRFPWQDADPYLDLYQRWTAGTPDLPPAVHAVLAARQAALKRKARADLRDLRDAVQRLGYAVRDEGTKQYWRPLVRS